MKVADSRCRHGVPPCDIDVRLRLLTIALILQQRRMTVLTPQ
jgi:hypothetical protein